MKLTALKYGVTEITEKMAFQWGKEEKKIPIALLFFLIEAEGRKILVDVGCDTMPGFELFEFRKPVEVLEEYGVKRNEITDVILTHSHHDHIDSLRYYPGANVYIHKNELKSAENYFPNINMVFPMDGDREIVKNVEYKYIGGHSSGSGIVLIKAFEKTYVLCGDECYTKENILNKMPTGSSICLEKSVQFVEEYRKECYIPILSHDPELVEKTGYKTIIEEDK